MATATKHEPTEYQDQTVEMIADLLSYLVDFESFDIDADGEFDDNGSVIMPIIGNLKVRIGRDADAGTEFSAEGLF